MTERWWLGQQGCQAAIGREGGGAGGRGAREREKDSSIFCLIITSTLCSRFDSSSELVMLLGEVPEDAVEVSHPWHAKDDVDVAAEVH